MAPGDKLNVLPSRSTKVQTKQRLFVARNGRNLLKKKRDALEMKLRELKTEFLAKKKALDGIMRNAFLALAKAKFLGFDRTIITMSTADRADVFLRIKYWNVVGVKLPTFEALQLGCESFPLAGLARGGQQVLTIRRDFQEMLLYLAEMASLQYGVKVLLKAVRDNNMRVNGLEYVLIPRFENTIRYIDQELDELEREEFHRMKMSKAKKAELRDAREKFLQEREEELMRLEEEKKEKKIKAL